MDLSSAFCRMQEAYQRDRAGRERLENVRAIAGRSAIAWAHEALAAERREARRARAHVAVGEAIPEKPSSREMEDRLFSENPDRGFADGLDFCAAALFVVLLIGDPSFQELGSPTIPEAVHALPKAQL